MGVLEPRAQALTKEGAKHAGSKVAVRPKKQAILTIPDLVLLSLLAERPMHGYEANLEMERRDIRDWAAISRPQVYYSLEKLSPPRFPRQNNNPTPPPRPRPAVSHTT